MASSESGESETTIICSCKQTRFHLSDPVYQELDVEGLNILVTSGKPPSSVKSKGKAKSEGLEILTNATLKLNPGVHYALIGRNGTGKSTILRAISEKLIPGIPYATRISILQQTNADLVKPAGSLTSKDDLQKPLGRSVLEEVVENAISRSSIQQEIEILQPAVETSGDSYAPVRALRQVQHGRMKQQHFWMDKDARLRSGTRGMAARKALLAFEKQLEEFQARLDQEDSDISNEELKDESEMALSLLTDLQAQLEPTRLADIETRAKSILTGLGFPKANFDKKVSALSGGWRMRCALASALLQESDILILDEPTNFLDLLGILWLQRHLLDLQTSSKTTVILVSHDRDFVNTCCQEIINLREKDLTYFRGNLTQYEEEQRSKGLYLGRMKEAQDKQRAHMEKTIQQNMKAGKANGDDNKLRQAKSRQKKLDDRMGMQVSATGGRFKLNRDHAGWHNSARAEIDVPTEERGVSITLPPAPDLRFPGPLISLEGIDLKYKTAPTPVLQNVDLVIHMGDRVGLVGLNGCGKTTIIKLITDVIKPSKGTVTKHPRLRLGYYSQNATEDLQSLGRSDESLTALSLLTKDVEGELDEGELRGLLGSLGLPGRIASDVPLTKLSGGQLVRLALARILWKSPQLLVLDEVTTHLDFYTVSALSEALSEWNGAILLVSHDRYMIRHVVEGEKMEDDDEDQIEVDEKEETRRREVYLLRGGKLMLQAAGVSDFEQSLEKKMAKLGIS